MVLSVTDDGCGFDADDMADSEVMAMMCDYACAIGRHIEIISAPTKGTTASLTAIIEPPNLIPLVPENRGEHQFSPIWGLSTLIMSLARAADSNAMAPSSPTSRLQTGYPNSKIPHLAQCGQVNPDICISHTDSPKHPHRLK